MKTAVVSGASGQDGQVLIDLLVQREYRVVALVRPGAKASPRMQRHQSVQVLPLDIRDKAGVASLLARDKPEEFYNLAALSSAGGQWDTALETMEVNGLAVVALLEAALKHSPKTRICQASSCEVYGAQSQPPQSEVTPLAPDTPYAIAKAQAQQAMVAYRKKYGLFACSAILFSHASEMRSAKFLIGKVTLEAAEVARGLRETVSLRSLAASRDWGYAEDYMRAMHAMLQAPQPRDYVVASGEEHSVQEVCALAFAALGLDYQQHVIDEGVTGMNASPFLGDTTRIRSDLQWTPRVSFREMIVRLTLFHLSRLSRS